MDAEHSFTLREVTQVDDELNSTMEVGDSYVLGGIDRARVNSSEVLKKLDLLKREFEHDRKRTDEWRQSIDEKLNILMSRLGCPQEEGQSQSLLEGMQLLPPSNHKQSPFVTITYKNGSTEEIYFSEDACRDIMSASKVREIVRKVLLRVHNSDVALLRTYTLTGKTNLAGKRTLNDMEDDSQYLDCEGGTQIQGVAKTQLPMRTVLIVQEVVKKLNPPRKELVDLDPSYAAQHSARLIQESRSSITSVLNYFHGSYDSNGLKIQQTKNSKTTPSPQDSSAKSRTKTRDTDGNQETN